MPLLSIYLQVQYRLDSSRAHSHWRSAIHTGHQWNAASPRWCLDSPSGLTKWRSILRELPMVSSRFSRCAVLGMAVRPAARGGAFGGALTRLSQVLEPFGSFGSGGSFCSTSSFGPFGALVSLSVLSLLVPLTFLRRICAGPPALPTPLSSHRPLPFSTG